MNAQVFAVRTDPKIHSHAGPQIDGLGRAMPCHQENIPI